jgi:hypothetical protein
VSMYAVGFALILIGGIAAGTVLWDEIVDFMTGLKRRGHRKLHDVERTRRLHAPRARASARARVPLQRGAKHKRAQ